MDEDGSTADRMGMSRDENQSGPRTGHRMNFDDDVKDSAGKLFRHPSAVGNEGEGHSLSMQTARSPSKKPGKFGKLHRLYASHRR
jgi:hypothetical protein